MKFFFHKKAIFINLIMLKIKSKIPFTKNKNKDPFIY